jgi:hypothetical protein
MESDKDVSALLKEIASLREEVDDLRASAKSWEKLYAAAVRRRADATQQIVELAALAAAAFVFRIPDFCAQCGARGSVQLEQTVKSALVVLNWHCRACSHEWLVTAMERVERRTARAERRKKTRTDRRRR